MTLSATLWFATEAFVDSDDERQARINESIGGAALAAWLASELQAAGIAASQPWAEDHGWDFSIKTADERYLIVCTIEDTDVGERLACVQIHREKPRGRGSLAAANPLVSRIMAMIAARGYSSRLE